jgi:hypothetical protein
MHLPRSSAPLPFTGSASGAGPAPTAPVPVPGPAGAPQSGPVTLVCAPPPAHRDTATAARVPHGDCGPGSACATGGGPSFLVHRLPHGPAACPAARGVARALLEGWGMPEQVVDDTVLVVSELVTNAVNHALPPVCLRLSAPARGTVRVEVSDGGPRGVALSGREPGDGGRGLMLVGALARAHGRDGDGPGATAWAEVTADSAAG